VVHFVNSGLLHTTSSINSTLSDSGSREVSDKHLWMYDVITFIDFLACPSTFIKVIPQKLNLSMNFFETFLESSLLSTVSKKTKMIGHHSCLRDMMGQTYPIYACARANHAHYSSAHVTFCRSSKHTSLK